VRVVLEKFPERVVERAVKGMVPHTALGKQQLRHLKVYAGPSHPHLGQAAQFTEADEEATS
jgi:large subunit ribosomal protein L13